MTHLEKLLVLVGAFLLALPTTSAQGAGEDNLWPQEPTHIDRSSQTYERIAPAQAAVDTRQWVIVPQRIDIIDGARFSFGGTTYRIGKVHPIASKRLCFKANGSRWSCGRAATVLLNNLVRGKRLLCDIDNSGGETVLNDCLSSNRDVAAEIIGQGFGRTNSSGLLGERQNQAQNNAAGLWQNPDCAIDFDHC